MSTLLACSTSPAPSATNDTTGTVAVGTGVGVPIGYRVGGSVTGLDGSGLVLQNDAGDDLKIAADGTFVFATKLVKGDAFAVTVKAQPSSPSQTCTVAGGSGRIVSGDVASVTVSCATDRFTLSGRVTGLVGQGLVLTSSTGDGVAVNANGGFAFPHALDDGTPYQVAIASQPTSPHQTCTLSNEAGALGGRPVTDIAVTCATDDFAIGGTVSGLLGSGLVLQDSGGDELSIAADGTFAFPARVKSGESFAVTLKAQPSSPAQTCTVVGGSGNVVAADIGSVAVVCDTKAFALSGTVSGLAGSGLVLTNGGGDDLAVNAASFAFARPLPSDAPYAVAIKSQPTHPWQTCAVDAATASGTMSPGGASTSVACTTNRYPLGGTIAGLAGSGLVLANGTDSVAPAANATTYSLGTALSGSSYAFAVASQPTSPWQTCAVANGAGTVDGAAVVAGVTCTTNTYAIHGTVASAGGDLVLSDGIHDVIVPLRSDGTFSFPAVASGQSYAITVRAAPTNQTCTVTNGAGTITNAPANVTVSCVSQRVFAYTGAEQSFVVPTGVGAITIDAQGGAGANSAGFGDPGGLGGRVVATIAVSSGTTVWIDVGGSGASGGFNGGGAATTSSNGYTGGTGGGASDVRIGGHGLANRVVVAGGGGGGGDNGFDNLGGAGGDLVGASGSANVFAPPGTFGTGGTQSAGGAAGTFASWSPSAIAGSLGLGGTAGAGGGGGGGGYYGGGGATWSGGGGGSSYATPTASNVVHVQGYRSGDGQVILSW